MNETRRELGRLRSQIETVFLLEASFVNEYYPMQWDTTIKTIYKRIKQGQPIEYFIHWYERHPRKGNVKHQVVMWPINLVKFWDECFSGMANSKLRML